MTNQHDKEIPRFEEWFGDRQWNKYECEAAWQAATTRYEAALREAIKYIQEANSGAVAISLDTDDRLTGEWAKEASRELGKAIATIKEIFGEK